MTCLYDILRGDPKLDFQKRCQHVLMSLYIEYFKGFRYQYSLQLESYITLRVDLLWSIFLNFTPDLFKKSGNTLTSIFRNLQMVLRSECSWKKGAKALKGLPKIPDFFHESVGGMMVIIFQLSFYDQNIIRWGRSTLSWKKSGLFGCPLMGSSQTATHSCGQQNSVPRCAASAPFFLSAFHRKLSPLAMYHVRIRPFYHISVLLLIFLAKKEFHSQ